MRDSWIDKKELDELVGGFSSVRGKSRKRGSSAIDNAAEIDPGAGKAASVAGESREDVPGGELISSESAIEMGPMSFFDDPSGPEGSEPEGVSRVGLESHAGVPFSGITTSSAAGVYSPPDEPENFDSGRSGVELEAVEVVEDPRSSYTRMMDLSETATGLDPEDGDLNDPDISESARSEGAVSKLIVEDAVHNGENSRKIPTFLGGTSESPDFRQRPISIRDADRAHTALAEARARVDESRLLSVPPQDRAEATGSGIEAETAFEPPPLNPAPEVGEVEQRAPYPGKYLHERLENFGDSVQRELGTSEVAVCDEDGLLLYKSAGFGYENTLHSALLLHVSGRINSLIGLSPDGVTQLSDGRGLWRCLVSGAGCQGKIFAGFTLREPLDQDKIDFWQKALVEAATAARPCN